MAGGIGEGGGWVGRMDLAFGFGIDFPHCGGWQGEVELM